MTNLVVYQVKITMVTGEIIERTAGKTIAKALPEILKRDTAFLALENHEDIIFLNKHEIRKLEIKKPSPEPYLLTKESVNAVEETNDN